ncbi:protein of unknown function DUF45 [Gottschalkia purinilytica]|uniref:YgjP-like metallopeptidase domain-containing protein n=1 Tax=Gottschalkia purinilytica TaxID=1503 RepID=A0A0L0WCX9_GOTPU|nr:SprT family zinc-dependent metalloprotease [Gottschalkia purinilytica]KNF09270.1 protein of unknown function DUF45 [Gottschalkia purinilytica]
MEIKTNIIYRKRKTIKISIESEDSITVISPPWVNKKRIMEIVELNSEGIYNEIEKLKELGFKHKNIEERTTILYLGREYRFKITFNEKIKQRHIELTDNIFCVYTNTQEQEKIVQTIKTWYIENGIGIIIERINYYKQYIDVSPQKIKLKEQKKRWGTCTSKGNLLFNWRIIMAPIDIIDYIVVHEMCHLIHFNHSKNFWNLVESIIPDYRERKEWLKINGLKLFF